MLLSSLYLLHLDTKALAVVDMQFHLGVDMLDDLRPLDRKQIESASSPPKSSSVYIISHLQPTAAMSRMFFALYDARAFARAKCTRYT